jgi:hypothetical protein
MPSLGTGFGSSVPHACQRTASGDFVPPGIRLEPLALSESEDAAYFARWANEPALAGLRPGSEAYMKAIGRLVMSGRSVNSAPSPAAEPATANRLAATKPKESAYLTVGEAADRARRAVGTIYNAISAGNLNKKLGSYLVLIAPAELERWLSTKRPTRKQAEAAKQKQADAVKKKHNRR